MPAAVDAWGPFVFVHADPEAPPLRESLGELPELLEDRGVATASLVFRERATYTVAANWKVAVENYLECYHCAVAHPGFSRLVDVDPDAYVLEGATRRWSQYGETRDGAGSCQFHLVWPALKVNAYPGVANLSIGPVWPVGSERTDGFLDYYFGEGVTRRRGGGADRVRRPRRGRGLGPRRVGAAGRPVGRDRARTASARQRAPDRRFPARGARGTPGHDFVTPVNRGSTECQQSSNSSFCRYFTPKTKQESSRAAKVMLQYVTSSDGRCPAWWAAHEAIAIRRSRRQRAFDTITLAAVRRHRRTGSRARNGRRWVNRRRRRARLC